MALLKRKPSGSMELLDPIRSRRCCRATRGAPRRATSEKRPKRGNAVRIHPNEGNFFSRPKVVSKFFDADKRPRLHLSREGRRHVRPLLEHRA